MAQNQATRTMDELIAYWQMHRKFDANIADLAKYTRVSRDTIYRWLNRQSQPKQKKQKLIQEWLKKQQTNPPSSVILNP